MKNIHKFVVMNKTIYFAGGCFWGVEHFFSKIQGVITAQAGYANGSDNSKAPSYEEVYTDTTGFAETVKVVYRPSSISLKELVDYYFSIIDPLSLNKQGHDEGTRYRTGVFYEDPEDRACIEEVFKSVEARIGQPIVVELEPLRGFFQAEERHQQYLEKNPTGYCHLPLKVFAYVRLYQDLKLILEGEEDIIAKMANASALIYERMRFFWVGFYRVVDNQLVLGPFQGPHACFRIAYGKGVCGSSWKQESTLVVPDVEKFPGHIACSSQSRSEIVVPVFTDGKVSAVLDIDSDELGTFDDTDALWLEKICSIL